MAFDPTDQWARITIKESLVGRSAGGSAKEQARELRQDDPVRSLAARLLGVHTDERAWRVGARGERATARWLRRLPNGWHVFNDVPVGERGANIDHVVVGPAGVFTVNAKNLSGKVWVGSRALLHNGHKTSYLPKAVAEAKRAAGLLSSAVGRSVNVQPILAILADEWTIKQRPTDVFVGSPRSVTKWLQAQPARLSSAEVVAIGSAASKPATWVAPKRSS
jgi:hypothetical protein